MIKLSVATPDLSVYLRHLGNRHPTRTIPSVRRSFSAYRSKEEVRLSFSEVMPESGRGEQLSLPGTVLVQVLVTA
jgi:hypothetical protein